VRRYAWPFGPGANLGSGDKDVGTMHEDRQRALGTAISQIEKAHGKGAIMQMGTAAIAPVATISTGAISLDAAIGVGGVPRGRITEIYGPESSGKTTLCLHVIANAQREGGVAAFIDAEHALDIEYARKLGVNVAELLVAQPDNGEQALEIAEALVRSGAVDVVVIDSVAALVPRAEIEGEMGDSHVGLHARLMSQALRKVTSIVHRTNTALIFTNQIREKIGVTWGSPETTTGGRALKFYASLRLDIRRIGSIKDKEAVVGNKTKVTVRKNKMAPPFREVMFDIMFGGGVDHYGILVDVAVEGDVIQKSGAWFSYGSHRLGQGRENAKSFLAANPVVASEVEEKVRGLLGMAGPAAAAPSAA
jgi:recombination protein RecA